VGGGLFGPLVVGLCWKDSNGRTYVSKHAAMASLLFGGGTAIVFELAPRLHKIFGGGIIPGVGVSLVLTMLISLLGLTSRKQTAKSVGV
jgi:hypothetical protein